MQVVDRRIDQFHQPHPALLLRNFVFRLHPGAPHHGRPCLTIHIIPPKTDQFRQGQARPAVEQDHGDVLLASGLHLGDQFQLLPRERVSIVVVVVTLDVLDSIQRVGLQDAVTVAVILQSRDVWNKP
ncbi:hypothetical protein D3C84_848850 [compost metagenome]